MSKHIVFILILITFTVDSLNGNASVTTFVQVPVEQWQKVQDKMAVNVDNVQLLLVTQHAADEKEILKQKVENVSNPTSLHYGQFMTYDQIYGSMLSKTVTNGHIVEEWAEQNGIKMVTTTKHKEFLMIKAPVDKIEQTFQTKLQLYQHKKTGKTVLRATSFQLPLHIHQRIAFIDGLSSFPVIPSKNIEQNTENTLDNAPIIHGVSSGFSKYRFSIQLVCPNGKKASNSLCTKQFSGYEITISKQSKPFHVPVHQAKCQTCSKATSVTALYCSTHSLSEDAVLCRFYLKQEKSIRLHEPHTFSIRTKFLEGYSNATAYRSAVWKVVEAIPPTLRSLYNVKHTPRSKPHKASRQAIAGFQQHLNMQSFKAFAHTFGKEFPAVFGKVYGSGYKDPAYGEFETSLDVQYMASMGSNIPMDYISSALSSDLPGFLLGFFVQLTLLEQNKNNVVPLVYSFSYGDDEPTIGGAYINVSETLFMIQSLTGKTFFAASGDNGISSFDGICRTQVYPSYPGSSAYVTSVGGTQFIKATSGCPRKLKNDCLEEVVATRSFGNGCSITSGGGFSNFINQPDYQKASVANYLKIAKNQLPPETYFNPSNRAFPDVSLVAHHYRVKVFGNDDIFLDGTSASSPTLAGLISLVVDQRLKMGKKPLGLLNPLLYSIATKYPAAFYDVTKGNNNCNQSPTCCKYGFVAAKQWDATTGFGSINHEILMEKLIMA